MSRTIEVIFGGEVLRPVEPLDLEPNTRLVVTLENAPSESPDATDDRPLMKYLALTQEPDLPSDYAAQLHHDLHGHPKQ